MRHSESSAEMAVGLEYKWFKWTKRPPFTEGCGGTILNHPQVLGSVLGSVLGVKHTGCHDHNNVWN